MSHSVWFTCPSSASSDSSFDEDEVNFRMRPCWPKYLGILHRRGFRLDTVRDVKNYYRSNGAPKKADRLQGLDDDSLCPDAGLPDNLFRGIKTLNGTPIMVKAVHRKSRELDIIRFLSSPSMMRQSLNHCIPVHDLIDVADDSIAFIVMEQWSPINDSSCCLRCFLTTLRQCIEHCSFMHKHHIAHLDISLRNLLTDYKGHYAFIDFELSRRFEVGNPRITGRRGTELPPECIDGAFYDPYKVDVWALGVLILRVSKLAGFCIPEILDVVKPMLHENPAQRPSLDMVMQAFNHVTSSTSLQRLQSLPSTH
ncbi:kinase-like domain-containing protein [Rhodocollybia butyracea]|uniref:Kinase-like domain-containing protein n=1 Tax=Rhodocollybia butyracea TaxID=206335 RepID=A0A9P5UDL2_9AGAR|nr:kinase-like domain-containing protein [Rhodocollybia butyracea]